MRKRWLMVVAAPVLLTGIIVFPMILRAQDTYRVEYTYKGVRYTDGRVYGAWRDSRIYVHLPHADHHPWWLVDAKKKMIYLPLYPARRLGLWWKPRGKEPGAAIDFTVKVGTWQWSFADEQIRFANDALDCVIRQS